MSRGGRGGFGGRGGLKGATWNQREDEDIKLDVKPSELFPPYPVPYAQPVTERERREVKFYKLFRDQIHQGPLYTKPRKRDPGDPKKMYGDDQDNDQYTAKGKADFDPFTGVHTYSMKYDQKQRTIPQLSERPFNKELFPKELWSTISGEEAEVGRKVLKRKSLLLSGNQLSNLTPEQRRQALADKLKDVVDDDEADNETVRDEDEAEVEQDYDYEDDEAEMGGDYDGEQYFDGGENDEDDGGDGGGGGDDY